MSHWAVRLAILVAISAGGCVENSPIPINDGRPFSKAVKSLKMKFDGNDSIVIRKGDRHLRMQARTPATIILSHQQTRLALNFGSGSGQVLDFEVYDLQAMKQKSIVQFKQIVLAAARKDRCDIRADEISYVVGIWLGENSLRVKTENWSRRGVCSALEREWIVKLQN